MYKKRLLQLKPLIVLGGATFIWLVLPYALKAIAKTGFYEFQAPATVAASYVRDLQSYWAVRSQSKDELYEAAQSLKRLNAAYELTALKNQTLEAEIDRYESLLQLPSRPDYQYEVARVVERDFNAWWQRITIRKGRDYDIPIGAPVVFVGGVVGRVVEVNAYTSVVELVTSSRLRLAVVLEGDNRPLSYRGDGSLSFAQPLGIADYVPTDIQISNTDEPTFLVTSGMGGVFPAGLRVGRIRKLREGAGGMFYEGEIELDTRLAALTEVAVMVRIPQEPSPAETPEATEPEA